jgi:hypothetical protein
VLTCLAVNGCCYSYSPEAVAKREAENNYTRTKTLAALEKKVSELHANSTIKDMEKAFAVKGTHQFTLQKDGRNYLCLSFSVGESYSWTENAAVYYGIFENSKLYSIVEQSSVEYEIGIDKQGRQISHRKPIIPDVVFSAKRLFGKDLINSLEENFPRRPSSSNLGPMIPLVTVLGPVSVVLNSPSNLLHNIEVNKLKNKYDPLKIDIGMLSSEVESISGKPNHIYHPAENKMIYVYGSEYTIGDCPQYEFTWFSVEFENARVINVYSNDFFNDELMLRTKNNKSF